MLPVRSVQRFMPPSVTLERNYTDHALEFMKVCDEIMWTYDTSTPHRSETTGFAERAVRRVKDGTAATLVQCGFCDGWWSDAMEC